MCLLPFVNDAEGLSPNVVTCRPVVATDPDRRILQESRDVHVRRQPQICDWIQLRKITANPRFVNRSTCETVGQIKYKIRVKGLSVVDRKEVIVFRDRSAGARVRHIAKAVEAMAVDSLFRI